jgi:hypothetical protein
MSDIVQRLRAWSPLIASGLEVPAASLAAEEAAAEIERLRVRVEVLERAMRGIEEFCEEGDRRPFIAVANTARAALEAKP